MKYPTYNQVNEFPIAAEQMYNAIKNGICYYGSNYDQWHKVLALLKVSDQDVLSFLGNAGIDDPFLSYYVPKIDKWCVNDVDDLFELRILMSDAKHSYITYAEAYEHWRAEHRPIKEFDNKKQLLDCLTA